jgi:hypothetical protein
MTGQMVLKAEELAEGVVEEQVAEEHDTPCGAV